MNKIVFPLYRMRTLFLAITLLYSSFPSVGQVKDTLKVTLTLQEAVTLAREQSPLATQARHQFRNNYWRFRTYKAKFLPSLTLNADIPDFNWSTEKITLPDGTDEFVPRRVLNNSLDMELNQNVGLTGGSIFTTSSLQRIDNFSIVDDGISHSTSYLSYPFTIGFRQPINGYNEFRWERMIEPARYEEAKKDFIHTLEMVSNRAVGHFFDLILAQINLEIAEKNYANTDTLYRIAEGRYQLGTIAENELLQMELSFHNARAALNSSSIDLEDKKIRIRSFLGFSEMMDIELVVPKEIPEVNVDFGKALQEANNNNPEVMAMNRQLMEAEQSVAAARADKGLQINLFGQYGLNQDAENLPGAYVDPEQQWRVRLGFEVPILDWGLGRGQLKMAQSAEEVTKANVIQARTDFEQEVFLQVMQFNLQDDQLLIAAKSDDIANRRYEVSKQRFLIGKIDVLDLNVALEEKDVARRGYVQALRNYWNYFYGLRILTLYDWIGDKRLEQDFNEVLLK